MNVTLLSRLRRARWVHVLHLLVFTCWVEDKEGKHVLEGEGVLYPIPQKVKDKMVADGTLAAQYYRRARNQGVEDARARLDALCGALRQAGGQEAVEAGC